MTTFGKIRYSGGWWIVICEPHVRTKIKRLFPQVSQRAGEVIEISDNDETCRDLLWFLDRYPMEVEAGRDRLRQGAADHIEAENQVAALLAHRRPPDDFALALPAREYQQTAAALALIKGGLLCADDVGLGKTVTGICPMAKADHLPVLVVTLTHLPTQWAAELARFAPGLQVHILKTGRPYDLVRRHSRKKDETPRLPDVIISNYHKLHGWADVLAGLVRYVVFDEVQELRHSDSNKYAAARFIAQKARLRFGLSATPIYNYGDEFFSVIDILQPGALGTREEFIREWCNGNDKKISEPRAFGEYLRREGLMIRRTRSHVGRELPPPTKIVQIVESDKYALDRIKGSAVELAKTILATQQNYKGEKFLAAGEFDMLMRQATGIAKAPYVAEFVRMFLESGEKVVLYGWHREVYNIWLQMLKEYHPRLYTGTESPKQKEAAKQAFIDGDCRLLIISLRAGAGLDGLQKVCRTVVNGELDWSPAVLEQNTGRVYRDGQDDSVMAYFLISEEGSDPIIADILGIKRGQIEGVRDPDAELIEKLETDTGNVKRLAEAYLKKIGVHIDELGRTKLQEAVPLS
jgi:SNF2 family DNA or RNA helicase